MKTELLPPTRNEKQKLLAELRRFPFYHLAAQAAGIDPDLADSWMNRALQDTALVVRKIRAGQGDVLASTFSKFWGEVADACDEGKVNLLRPLVDRADKGRKDTQRWLAKWIRENPDGQDLVDRARESLKADPIRDQPRK